MQKCQHMLKSFGIHMFFARVHAFSDGNTVNVIFRDHVCYLELCFYVTFCGIFFSVCLRPSGPSSRLPCIIKCTLCSHHHLPTKHEEKSVACLYSQQKKTFPNHRHILNETWQEKIDSLGTDALKKEVGSLKEEIDQLKAGKTWPPGLFQVCSLLFYLFSHSFCPRNMTFMDNPQDPWHTEEKSSRCPPRCAMTTLTGMSDILVFFFFFSLKPTWVK